MAKKFKKSVFDRMVEESRINYHDYVCECINHGERYVSHVTFMNKLSRHRDKWFVPINESVYSYDVITISEGLEESLLQKFKTLIKAPQSRLKYRLEFELGEPNTISYGENDPFGNRDPDVRNSRESEARIIIHMKPTVSDPTGVYSIVSPISAVIEIRIESSGVRAWVKTEHHAGDEILMGKRDGTMVPTTFDGIASKINSRFKEWIYNEDQIFEPEYIKTVTNHLNNVDDLKNLDRQEPEEPEDPADWWKKS